MYAKLLEASADPSVGSCTELARAPSYAAHVIHALCALKRQQLAVPVWVWASGARIPLLHRRLDAAALLRAGVARGQRRCFRCEQRSPHLRLRSLASPRPRSEARSTLRGFKSSHARPARPEYPGKLLQVLGLGGAQREAAALQAGGGHQSGWVRGPLPPSICALPPACDGPAARGGARSSGSPQTRLDLCYLHFKGSDACAAPCQCQRPERARQSLDQPRAVCLKPPEPDPADSEAPLRGRRRG